MADDTLGSLSVLIVDDGMFSRRTLQRTLETMGVGKVIVAESGEEALQRLEDAAPAKAVDLVITDVLMQGMDGFDLVKRIRRDGGPAYRDVPIIILTGQKTDARKKQAVDGLIDGFIAKPATAKVLAACMEKALKR